MRRCLCHCRNDVVAVVVMALLPSPICRLLAIVVDDGNGAMGDEVNNCHRRRCTGIFAVVTMALLPSPCATGDKVDDDVNEDVDSAILLLPSMCRHLCHRHNGVDAVFAMALLPSPMRRHLVIVNDDGDGATGDEVDDNGYGAIVSLLSMRRCLHRLCDGVVAVVVMASLPSPMRRLLAIAVNNDGNGAKVDNVEDDGNGAILSLPSMHRLFCRCCDGVVAVVVMALLPSPMHRLLAIVVDGSNGTTGNKVDNVGNGAILSSLSMHRRLRRRRDGIAALVAMALLPSLMCRLLAVVNDDSDSTMSDEVDDNGVGVKLLLLLMHRHLCHRCDGIAALITMASLPSPMRRRLVVINDDGNGAMGDKVNNDGNRATGDSVDDDGEGPTYNDIDDDCDSATGDKVDNDGDSATGYDDDNDDNGHQRLRQH